MSEKIIQLKWKRPDSAEYSKVWHRFKARDLNSDQLVEYRIEDLLESRAEDAFNHMRENYLADEPVSQAMGGYHDINQFNDYVFGWRSILAQKMPLVCYREGSDEIVGINWVFITCKEDRFFEQLYDNCKSPVTKTLFDITNLLWDKFDVFEAYGVDKYMASLALSVGKNYRGRAIGDHLLAARINVCKEFGIKLTHTMFSSNFSSRNAERVGFKKDLAIRYDEYMKMHPECNLSNIKSDELNIKTLLIDS